MPPSSCPFILETLAEQSAAVMREVQPELAHAARGLMAGGEALGAGSSGG